MKWFSLFVTAYVYMYAVIFFYMGVTENNNNALIMSGIITFMSIFITSICIKNFKKKA